MGRALTVGTWLLAGALVATGASPRAARADDPAPKPRPRKVIEVTPATVQAIDRGLQAIARRQRRDGSIESSVPVAATAIGCLAFMSGGSTPGRGPHAENITRGLEFILRCVTREGFITEIGSNSSGMHGHGFAVLFLAESLGMIEDPYLYDRALEALRKSVSCIERAQNQYGGWNATPDGGRNDDGSGAVAVMQVAALRAARNNGIAVNPGTIEQAKKYLLLMTSTDGWTQYNYGFRGSHRSAGLTGPGMYMLGALGLFDDGKYEKGIKNVVRSAPFLGGNASNDSGWSRWYYYTLFYSSLAVFQYGGQDWEKWYPAMRDSVLKMQKTDGTFDDDPYGGLYGAFAVLSLALPYRYLPMFQDGGLGGD